MPNMPRAAVIFLSIATVIAVAGIVVVLLVSPNSEFWALTAKGITVFAVGAVGICAAVAAQQEKQYLALAGLVVTYVSICVTAVTSDPVWLIVAALAAAYARAIPPLLRRPRKSTPTATN